MISKLDELKELALREHYYCEDSWYSCPLAPDGSCNDSYPEDECICGADKINKKIEELINEIKQCSNSE